MVKPAGAAGEPFPLGRINNFMSVLPIAAALSGLFLLITVVWEGFETIILPRSVTRRFRTARLFYRNLWTFWAGARHRVKEGKRELFLSYFGPVSLPLLLIFWAVLLILSFTLMEWAESAMSHAGERLSFETALYASGVTFFTLGYGDIVPHTSLGRFLAVLEAGVGFGFLAIVIGYLPVLYQAFSRREAVISLLDARASSPPSATEMLRRHSEGHSMIALVDLLRDWEKWASELLESHLSYPVLSYYRSQHDHQSWLGALTTIMDTCALLLVGCAGDPPWQSEVQWQARMTLAMARHAVIDLAYVFSQAPEPPKTDRLPAEDLARLRSILNAAGLPLCDGPEDEQKLADLRELYEPYVSGLGEFLCFSLPPWLPSSDTLDNWQTSAWDHPAHF